MILGDEVTLGMRTILVWLSRANEELLLKTSRQNLVTCSRQLAKSYDKITRENCQDQALS